MSKLQISKIRDPRSIPRARFFGMPRNSRYEGTFNLHPYRASISTNSPLLWHAIRNKYAGIEDEVADFAIYFHEQEGPSCNRFKCEGENTYHIYGPAMMMLLRMTVRNAYSELASTTNLLPIHSTLLSNGSRHLLILGRSGAGKSFAARQVLKTSQKCRLIWEDYGFADTINGLLIKETKRMSLIKEGEVVPSDSVLSNIKDHGRVLVKKPEEMRGVSSMLKDTCVIQVIKGHTSAERLVSNKEAYNLSHRPFRNNVLNKSVYFYNGALVGSPNEEICEMHKVLFQSAYQNVIVENTLVHPMSLRLATDYINPL